MTDPFDRALWPLPPLAVQLDDLVGAADDREPDDVVSRSVRWATERLLDGATPREVSEAALWLGLRRTRTEGRGPIGLVTHSVLAAGACAAIATPGATTAHGDGAHQDEAHEDERDIARLAAVQHVAYTVGHHRGGATDDREGPHLLGWYEPVVEGPDPVEEFLDAALAGEVERSDHRWLAAATSDPDAAEDALVSAGAAGYHLNEHKLIYPAQLRSWLGEGDVDPVVFRAAARYAGNHLQDRDHATARRADAAALALDAMERAPSTFGRLERGGHERVSTVATGLARTPREALAPLLLASLEEGLAPEDLADAVALANAAAFAITSFGDDEPVGAIHACTGADALQLCMARAQSPELRYELALCATESPTAALLEPIAELWTPPFDDGGLEDLLVALGDGDPDAAAEAATAVPPDDAPSVDAAWRALRAAAVSDQWLVLHAVKHVVAMERGFRATDHPARIWFLAAAARTAAHATALGQPIHEMATQILSKGS